MNIEDFEIKIKKFDETKNLVLLNVIILKEVEIRGFMVRFIETKYSKGLPVWIVSPPLVMGRNKKTFWIFYLKNTTLWQILQKRIIDLAKEFTGLL